MADMGQIYPAAIANPELVKVAMSAEYTLPVLVPADHWHLPDGAKCGEKVGPT